MKWFEIILVVLTLGTGIISLLDKLFLAKRRAARAGLLDTEPPIIDYCRSFFPVLAAVLILRSFIAEPYKIPSSSMMPNLLIGDFILVNKFAYGLRLPITNTKIIPIGKPNRGDVAVFKPPHKPDENWIKRVIGLPGDRIGFHGDTLYINGEPVKYILKANTPAKMLAYRIRPYSSKSYQTIHTPSWNQSVVAVKKEKASGSFLRASTL